MTNGKLKTRTVCIINTGSEVSDYIDYLNGQGLPVVKTKSLEHGRIVELTFAY